MQPLLSADETVAAAVFSLLCFKKLKVRIELTV